MSYLKIGDVGWTIEDTGFGNRHQLWSAAHELNKFNDFKFTILVEAEKWTELKFLDFPRTETSTDRFHNLDYSSTIDLRTNWLKPLDESKNYNLISPDVYDEWPPYEIEKSFWDKCSHEIVLKDKKLESKIQDKLKDVIGIHIRHWPMIEQPNEIYFKKDDLMARYDYKMKMERVKREMKKYKGHKFYISSDCTYDEPGKGPLLPNYSLEHHWLSEIYDEFDVIDYRDILESDEKISKFSGDYQAKDNNNVDWIKVLDINGEGRVNISKVYKDKWSKVDIFYNDLIDDLYELKIKRDIVDLFSLIYSKEFIPSTETGPFSSWTDYVESYRKELWQE